MDGNMEEVRLTDKEKEIIEKLNHSVLNAYVRRYYKWYRLLLAY